MVQQSSYDILNFDNTVTSMLTAKSAALLVKTTVQEAIKSAQNNGTSVKDELQNVIDYNDDNSEKSISDILKDYTQKTSEYIKNYSSNNSSNKNTLSKDDYENAGMGGYYEAQNNLKYSKILSNYVYNKNLSSLSTFTISV